MYSGQTMMFSATSGNKTEQLNNIRIERNDGTRDAVCLICIFHTYTQ